VYFHTLPYRYIKTAKFRVFSYPALSQLIGRGRINREGSLVVRVENGVTKFSPETNILA
jgi:hypothetical protein